MTPLSEHPFGSGGLIARRYRLDNGLGVILVADPVAPICAYHTWFRVGSRDERVGRTGIAHLFEHLMFNETERLAPGEFNRQLEAVGADTNAATWLDWTFYREVVPTAHLGLVMDLESERMANLVLREPQLESERSVVTNERKQRVEDDVEGFLEEELHRLAFDVHPYRWPTIGWMEDIQAITLDDARAFYRTYYAPNNATIVVVGDLDEQRTLAMIETRYGKLPSQELPSREVAAEPEQTAERRRVFAKQVLSDRLFIGYRAVALGDADHAPLEVAAELLCNGQSSTLYRKLVAEAELVSSVHASVPGFRDPGLFQIVALLQRGHSAAEAERHIYEEIARIAEHSVDEAALDKAKNRLESRHWHGLRPHDGKAEGLGHHETTLGDYRSLFDEGQRLRAVTSDDVRRAVARHLTPARRTVVIAEPTPAPRKAKKTSPNKAARRSSRSAS